MKLLTLLLGVFAIPPILLADSAAVQFTQKPVAARDGAGARIEFAVNSPTDVAVFVEDAAGKTVRHLAAGMLGDNAPAPLTPKSLKQSVLWDGQFDKGLAIAGVQPKGPFKVRVAIGAKPTFDGFLLHNPAASGPVVALAVGSTGEVYLFHRDPTGNGNMGGNKLKVIDRNGKPLRTLMPMPANLPADRLAALGVFQTPEGHLVPRINNYEQLSFHPDPLGSRGRSMPGFASPTVDKQGRIYWLMYGVRLACLDRDGGVPYPTFYSDPLLPQGKTLRMNNQYAYQFDRPSLAVSSDGQWIYFAGLFFGNSEKNGKPVPAVFRVNLTTRAPAEVFLGEFREPVASAPEDRKQLLTSPRGLAVVNGLLYVADFHSDRIVVVKEADKSVVAQVKIAKPDTIGVDPKTGAIYVCCSTSKTTGDLVKIENHTTGKELYRLTLPKAGGSPWDFEQRIAVDASASPVTIWLPGQGLQGPRLQRIEDAGDKFTPPADPRDLKTPWAEGPRDMNVDRIRDELYVKTNPERWHRINERSGQPIDFIDPKIGSAANGTQLVPWFDGNLYMNSWSLGLHRFDHAGKPLNWGGQEKNIIPLGGIMCFQERHLEVLNPEELLLVLNPQWHYEKYTKKPTPMDILFPQGKAVEPGKTNLRTSIGVIGPDGRLKRTVIWQCMPGATPRVDAQGNIYVAEMVKPADRSYPEFFDGKLEPPLNDGKLTYGPKFWSSYVYGSILKFPAAGGVIWFGKDLPPNVLGEPPADLLAKPKVKARAHLGYNPLATVEVQGAEWMRFGFSPYSCWSTTSTDTCMCEGSRFDVDGFGRVFYPNLGQFRIEVVDTNNNFLTTFGRYGNADAAGDAATIPVAWPTAVAVSDTHAYIGDTLNRRVVKVKFCYAAEERADVP